MSWIALTSTKLDDASLWCGNPGAPSPPDCLPINLGGSTGRSAILSAWTSGDLRTVDNKFYLPASGGHADWAGDQVIAVSAAGAWELKRNSSTAYAAIPGSGPWPYKYATGEPASKHTYDTVCYMPTKDKFYCGGGIYWSPGGESSPEVVWWLDPSVTPNTWAEKAIRPGGYGSTTAWDSVGNRLILRTSQSAYTYNPDLEDGGPNTAAYVKLFDQAAAQVEGSPLVIDAPNRKTYRIERLTGANAATGGLKMIDLNNLAAKEVQLTSTGDVEILSKLGTSLMFRDGRLVGLGPSTVAGRWAVYTAIVDGRGAAGQPPVQWVRDAVDANEPPLSVNNGFFKKFWGPVAGKYYVLLRTQDNVYEYTPSWTATTHTVNPVTSLTIEVLAP